MGKPDKISNEEAPDCQSTVEMNEFIIPGDSENTDEAACSSLNRIIKMPVPDEAIESEESDNDDLFSSE